jgi:hypothetical protein
MTFRAARAAATLVVALAVALGLGSVATGRAAQGPAPATVAAPAETADTAAAARRLLSDRCFRCHGPDASKRKAKLRLDTREGLQTDLGEGRVVVVPGAPDRSEMIRRITLPPDDEDVMPPAEAHLSLSPDEKALLTRWVASGAEYRRHWSWEPVGEPVVPTVEGLAGAPGTVPNPIDAFVAVRLAGAGLTPSPRASNETLLRRVSFGLTGLPPAARDLDGLLADRRPDAFARAVDRLLASPAYGERMAQDWLDLARYADTHGYQNDGTRDVSAYRDWVIDAFNQNLPYDAFLTWQLAGDLLPKPTRAQRIATAFNRLHRQTNEGGSIEEEFRTEYVADRVNTFGTAMLGVTLECARCHDHKFDAITQRDYFSLFAFFNSIDESGLYSHFTNAMPTPTLWLWPAGTQAAHARVVAQQRSLERQIAALSTASRAPARGWFARARLKMPLAIAHLTFDSVTKDRTPDVRRQAMAVLRDEPQPVTLPAGGALKFSGDNAVVLDGLREFARTDPFSIRVRLQPTERQSRAVVVHQSRAWTDAGSRGFELTLEDGRIFFGLIHFWPGNAAAVRSREPLPIGEWSDVTVTYDGSSRAAGIRLYVDGRPVATEVVRDRLTKGIGYDRAAGDRSSPTHPLTLGARFRDSGFRNGLVDDLQVFDDALTEIEVAGRLPVRGDDPAVLEHYLARVDQPAIALRARLRQARVRQDRLVSRVPELMVMEEMATPRPAHLLARGAYDAPRERVERDTPASLPPFPADQPRNRLGLARWLTSRQHPLAARVAVNRIWRLHFGRGLVPTPEDLGSQGRVPTHPELLDWLAARFMDSGWDVKALHRLILSSATYQQRSDATPDQRRRDPDNEWLARGPALRLPAEHVRDAALAASGLLTRRIGGPSVKPYQPEGLWEQAGTGQTYVQDTGASLYRRSLYTFWRRTSPPPSLTTFDAVSREVCVARREVTATPLQSLVLLNDPQFVEAARVLAERLVREFPVDGAARHHEAFRRLIGRAPDADEAAIVARAFDEQRRLYAADTAGARALLGVGASPHDERLPAVDVAATTAVASLIMNFDAFVVAR